MITSLTNAEFHILLALSRGDKHGYAIMKWVEENPGAAIRLGPATLYRTIRTMLGKGWIEELDERPDPQIDDERRRYYRITGAGRVGAAEEAERLAKLVSLARDSGFKVLRYS